MKFRQSYLATLTALLVLILLPGCGDSSNFEEVSGQQSSAGVTQDLDAAPGVNAREVYFVNESGRPIQVCLYQDDGGDSTPLAWMNSPTVFPRSQFQFSWTSDTSLSFSSLSSLSLGAVYTRLAEVNTNGASTVELVNGQFQNLRESSEPTTSSILVGSGNPGDPGSFVVAIGEGGKPARAKVALRNQRVNFSVTPSSYRIAAGNFTEGEVLSDFVRNSAQLDFFGGTSVTATLDQSNQWSVRAGRP